MRIMINEFRGKYEFLSNFYYCKKLGTTVEHLFQAAKTKDLQRQRMILKAATPGRAKSLGRTCPLRDDWELIKDPIMAICVALKFQDPKLQKALLDTKNAFLMEGNWWHDNYWGNCFCENCSSIVGHNGLGKILMELRSILKLRESVK